MEDAPRRPLRLEDREFVERLEGIQQLSGEDKAPLLHILDALVAKNRIKAFAHDLS